MTTTASNFTGIHRGAEGSSRFLPPPVIHLNFTSVIPAPPVAPGLIPMNMDAVKQQFGTPLTCRHCGKVRHFAQECPQAYDVCYMIVNDRKELLEHLLTVEDVPKPTKVDEQVEVEQERPENFVSSSE